MSNQNQGSSKAEAWVAVCVAGTLLLTVAYCAIRDNYQSSQSPLMLAPHLDSAYAGSALQKKMTAAGVSDYSLFCDKESQKLGLSMQFTRDSGVGNTLVVGDTECSTKGLVVGRRHWLVRPGLYAARSYDPDAFLAELAGLYERSRPLVEGANGENPVLAKAFEADYGEMAAKQGLSKVHFQCEDAGDDFDVVAVFHAGSQYTDETEVSVKCERDGQAFTVSLSKPGVANEGPRVRYQQQNGVSPSLANAAYGAYLRWNYSGSKF